MRVGVHEDHREDYRRADGDVPRDGDCAAAGGGAVVCLQRLFPSPSQLTARLLPDEDGLAG